MATAWWQFFLVSSNHSQTVNGIRQSIFFYFWPWCGGPNGHQIHHWAPSNNLRLLVGTCTTLIPPAVVGNTFVGTIETWFYQICRFHSHEWIPRLTLTDEGGWYSGIAGKTACCSEAWQGCTFCSSLILPPDGLCTHDQFYKQFILLFCTEDIIIIYRLGCTCAAICRLRHQAKCHVLYIFLMRWQDLTLGC